MLRSGLYCRGKCFYCNCNSPDCQQRVLNIATCLNTVCVCVYVCIVELVISVQCCYCYYYDYDYFYRGLLQSAPLQTATHTPIPATRRGSTPDIRDTRPETRTARRTRSLTRAAHTLRAAIHKPRAKAHALSLGAHTHTPRPGSQRANTYPQIIAAHTLRALTHTLQG